MSEGEVVDRTRASKLLSTWMANDPVVHASLRGSGIDPVVIRVSVKRGEQARRENSDIVRPVYTSLNDRNRDRWDFRQARRKGKTCSAAAADDLDREGQPSLCMIPRGLWCKLLT
jgi:hypothetical protein